VIRQNFLETGWQVVPRGAQVRRYQVFGERSSGTNFVKRLIGRNIALRPVESMGWKHGFPHMTAVPEDLAVICVVRDARAWALSMFARPWHCPPDMQVLEFSDFLRAPWATVADRARYFPEVDAQGGLGQPLQHDRHPLTGACFANLFALRRAKLTGLLSFYRRDCPLVFARLEAVQSDPAGFVDAVRCGFGVEDPNQPEELQPVLKRLGAKFKPSVAERPALPAEMSAEDLAFLRETLDVTQEAALGYQY
jgi:hypothetical protein